MTTFTYWEGPMPPIISLCLETFKRHNPDAVVLDSAEWERIWTHDRMDISHLTVVQKSDFIRNYMLRHYGGLWVDADCITMKSYAPLMKQMSDSTNGDFAFAFTQRPHTPTQFLNAFMGGSMGSRFFKVLWEKTCEKVALKRPLAREALGPSLVTKMAVSTHLGVVEHLDVMPIHWREKYKFGETGCDDRHETRFRDSAWCYMLTYGTTAMFDWSRKKLLESDTFMGYLFRKAMG